MDKRDNWTLLDCVDPAVWLIIPTIVKGSSRHQCKVAIPSIPICISRVTGRAQQLTVLVVEVSLTRNEGQKHSIVTGPEAPCSLGIDCLRRGCVKDP